MTNGTILRATFSYEGTPNTFTRGKRVVQYIFMPKDLSSVIFPPVAVLMVYLALYTTSAVNFILSHH